MEIKLLKDNCLDALDTLQKDIANAIISKETITLNLVDINLKTISIEELNFKLQNLSNDVPVVYRIINSNEEVSRSIYKAFAIAKVERFENRAYSKLNEVEEKDLTNCLYVGTSQGKAFKKRIREHLGFGSKSTYSMHMKVWLPAGTSITVEYFTVNLPENHSCYSAIEFLEQTLWMQEKPMFGKRSGLL